ncbi:hypothetical protein SCP_1004480 [Sparassis crispa]|uniref:T6SS Phospholipase effector Tle1-like catalytic domain-containing protein n=1 Tax=Sparassis crispa TaxID=139825 RepID=A0A401GYC7_9APHY|nr:hypothetical protein SCP_1004480 [Sparassis crispa]GBE87201.1 hypothetical protein SCP_1004480 [Sparassis crispa]
MSDYGPSPSAMKRLAIPRPMDESGIQAWSKSVETNVGRRLIVALDGTMNQFGSKNSNVIEIYARIQKDEHQLTYYNSGIGTYADPYHSSPWKRLKLKLSSLLDMAFALNFDKIILAAYRWLSENYRPGDQLFFFGFSRGAYQVRVLAGMIARVGLIHSGNEEQIPFAFELYEQGDDAMAERFKVTFSHRDVQVHFMGLWDTVSSVGVFRRKKDLPGTPDCKDVHYVRHALALDERRVKFSPEFITPTVAASHSDSADPAGTERLPDIEKDGQSNRPIRVKEVWFAGCHSDVGGGNKPNDKLLMDAIPALWMANEARTAGLDLLPTKVEWDLEKLKAEKPTESLTRPWWILELMPFLSRSEDCPDLEQLDKLPWLYSRFTHFLHKMAPHLGGHRFIYPHQKIHASVVLKTEYAPRAQFMPGGVRPHTWDTILREETIADMYMSHHKDIIEFDLYDTSSAGPLVKTITQGAAELELQSVLDRLLVLADFRV